MAPTTQTATQPGAPPAAPPPPDASGIPLANIPGLDREQLISIFQSLPAPILKQVITEGKTDITAALASLAQQGGLFSAGGVPGHPLPPGTIPPAGYPGMGDPGPSSHPQGPPNLAQLSQIAIQAQQAAAAAAAAAPTPTQLTEEEEVEKQTKVNSGGRRGRGGAAMGSDEWARQRKDNHKEVERRRRGNINEGINELGRIVPSGSGEKAKGAILSRAVQYIHHLKENEARNIEKWTLEKLLMDQAMGDLQSQLEEVRRMWEEERTVRQRLEAELDVLRGGNGGLKANGTGTKRANEDTTEGEDGKRVRTE